MKSARYVYTIAGDQDHFIATATADRLDDDPAIDQTGELRVVMDDAMAR